MATDNTTVGTTWTKVVDTAVDTFTLSAVEAHPWEVALGDSAPAATVYGHKVLDSDRQVTRTIGAGHVYARTPSGVVTLVRSTG